MRKVGGAAARLYGPLARGFGQRVEEALKRFETKKSAAEVMGLSTDQLGEITRESSVPNFASIAALARHIGVSVDWFAFAERTGTQSSSPPDQSTRKSFIGDDDTVRLPRLDSGTTLSFPRTLLTANFDSIMDRLAVLEAPGNAMEPTIKRNGLLIVDREAARTVDGEIFVFEFAGDLVVRRTQRGPDGALMLRADNPNYDLVSLSAEEATAAKILGRVVFIGNPV